jgi:hypothetical protein
MTRYQVFVSGYALGYAVSAGVERRWAGVLVAAAAFLCYVVAPLAVRGARSPRP